MVKLNTKLDKHTLDNEKRRLSIKEKEKAKLNQSLIIKQALSNASLNNSHSKKIIFDDKQDNDTRAENFDSNKSNGEKKNVLFSDSESEEEAPAIKEKVQFSGKKGFELLNLQSTYGNDERFKIDERFLEDEKEEPEVFDDNEADKDEIDSSKEKKKMINILESVLGESVALKENGKAKKRKFDMVRYDASKKEHEIYELKPDPETVSSKKKKLRKLMEKDTEEQPKPQVSKEKFYKVSEEIKNSFKEKEEGGQFSLLQTYGADDVEGKQEVELQKKIEEGEAFSEEQVKTTRERKRGKVVELKEEKSVAVAQGIWKENFFFEKNDTRFKDSWEFINKKNSEEAAEAAENYDQIRKRLKEILRLHMKKQLQKKDPFRNKIGGSSKKQLVYSRSKNRGLASKRKSPKVNSVKKV